MLHDRVFNPFLNGLLFIPLFKEVNNLSCLIKLCNERLHDIFNRFISLLIECYVAFCFRDLCDVNRRVKRDQVAA